MKLLVTGANGLIGAHVVRAALSGGHETVAGVRSTSDLSGLDGVPADLAYLRFDRPETLDAACAGVDVIAHCAGQFAYAGPVLDELHTANVDSTEAILRAAALARVPRVVVTSSAVTCGWGEDVVRTEMDRPGEPGPAYFASKTEQEQRAFALGRELGIDVVAACPTSVIGGPDHRLGPSNALLAGYLVNPLRTTAAGGGNLVAVRDVAAAHLQLATDGVPGERYLIGSENLTWREIHALVAELAGLPGPRADATHTTAYLAGYAGELVAKLTDTAPLFTRAEAETLGRYFWYSSEKIGRLGHRPRSTRQALVDALAWLTTSPHLPRFARSLLHLDPAVQRARELRPRALG